MNGMKVNKPATPSWRRLIPNLLVLALLAMLATEGKAVGQSGKNGSTVAFTFDFAPPGARSLGMGGAFLGLADDATAAYTNPAGLTNLAVGGPEVAMEFQSRTTTEFSPTGGHAFGDPTEFGLDTDDHPTLQEFEGETQGLSFLSFGYVLPGGVSLALYRHELLNVQIRTESQGLFLGPLPPLGNYDRTFASRSRQEANVVNLGLSGAYEILLPFSRRRDSLSLGVGLSLYELALFSRNDLYGGEGPACYRDSESQVICDRGPDSFFGPNLFLPDNHIGYNEESGADRDVRFSAGFLWKIGEKGRWRVGGAYRQGPRFPTRRLDLGFDFDQAREAVRAVERPSSSTFTIPDSYGVGVAYSTNEGQTKIALDYNRIRYSQRFNEYGRPTVKLLQEIGFKDARGKIKDSDQLHLGFEQVIPILEPALIGTVRLGVWREPYHGLVVTGSDPNLRDLTAGGLDEAQIHYAAGFGLVLKENVEVDLAADFSDLRDTVSVSIVKYF